MKIERFDKEQEFPLVNVCEYLNFYMSSTKIEELIEQFKNSARDLNETMKYYWNIRDKLIEMNPQFLESYSRPIYINEFCAGRYIFNIDLEDESDILRIIFDLSSDLKIIDDETGWECVTNIIRILLFLAIDRLAEINYYETDNAHFQAMKIQYDLINAYIKNSIEDLENYYIKYMKEVQKSSNI